MGASILSADTISFAPSNRKIVLMRFSESVSYTRTMGSASSVGRCNVATFSSNCLSKSQTSFSQVEFPSNTSDTWTRVAWARRIRAKWSVYRLT